MRDREKIIRQIILWYLVIHHKNLMNRVSVQAIYIVIQIVILVMEKAE